MPSRSYALMKPAPSSARLSIGSSVRSNAGSFVRFWKSAITTDTGSCAAGGISERAYHQLPPTARAASEHNDRGQNPHADDALDRDRHAVVVEPIELRFELGRRLITLLGVRLEAARDEPVERFGTPPARRISSGGGGCSIRRCSSAIALCRVLGPAAADEHVVEDQAEGVDVGALIDRTCPRACSGAMYSTVPTITPAIVPSA